MEPPISNLQIESHELLDFAVCTNQISSTIYQCSNDYTRELNNDKQTSYNCPYSRSKCTATGDIQWLVQHLRSDHHVEMHDGRCFSHRYVHHNPKHLHHATRMLTLLDCYGRQFCLYFEAFHLKKTPMYIAFMQFMGDEEEATSFSYTLEINGNGRKMTCLEAFATVTRRFDHHSEVSFVLLFQQYKQQGTEVEDLRSCMERTLKSL